MAYLAPTITQPNQLKPLPGSWQPPAGQTYGNVTTPPLNLGAGGVPAPPTTPSPTQWEKNWQTYLTGDPFYSQTVGQLSAMGISDAAERDRRAAQTFINLGEVPSGYTGPGITDTIRGLASENTAAGLSQLARLQHGYESAKRDSTNQLAARGILRSGETGHQLGELGLTNRQGQFDLRQSALDALAQGNYAFDTAETQRKMAQIEASFAAAQRAAQRGVGPLGSQWGQQQGGNRAGRFYLSPIGNANNMNQAYQPQFPNAPPPPIPGTSPPGSTASNLPPPPPGQMWAGPPGGEYLMPIPPIGPGL